MLQNAGGGPGLLPPSLNLCLSRAGFGQGWLMHFVKGAWWKQDGETRPTPAWEVLLCPDQPFFHPSGLTHHLFPRETGKLPKEKARGCCWTQLPRQRCWSAMNSLSEVALSWTSCCMCVILTSGIDDSASPSPAGDGRTHMGDVLWQCWCSEGWSVPWPPGTWCHLLPR